MRAFRRHASDERRLRLVAHECSPSFHHLVSALGALMKDLRFRCFMPVLLSRCLVGDHPHRPRHNGPMQMPRSSPDAAAKTRGNRGARTAWCILPAIMSVLAGACSSSATPSPGPTDDDDDANEREAGANLDAGADVSRVVVDASSGDGGWLGTCMDTNQCPPGDICTYLPNAAKYLCTRACTKDTECASPSSGCHFGLCQPM